jgi:hypothetical protein
MIGTHQACMYLVILWIVGTLEGGLESNQIPYLTLTNPKYIGKLTFIDCEAMLMGNFWQRQKLYSWINYCVLQWKFDFKASRKLNLCLPFSFLFSTDLSCVCFLCKGSWPIKCLSSEEDLETSFESLSVLHAIPPSQTRKLLAFCCMLKRNCLHTCRTASSISRRI